MPEDSEDSVSLDAVKERSQKNRAHHLRSKKFKNSHFSFTKRWVAAAWQTN